MHQPGDNELTYPSAHILLKLVSVQTAIHAAIARFGLRAEALSVITTGVVERSVLVEIFRLELGNAEYLVFTGVCEFVYLL